MARLPLVVQGFLIIEASRSHLNTPHSVGLRGTNDHSDAKTSIWQHTPSQDTNIHITGDIRTRNPSKQTAAEPSLIRCDYWNRRILTYTILKPAQLFEALGYKAAGRGFDSRWCYRNFLLTYSFRLHCDPEAGSASNRNEYQGHLLGVKAAGAWG
jgi:hypothetical protein